MDPLTIAGREFTSRLFVGTGKFASGETMSRAVLASQTQLVTVALRRVDPSRPESDILSFLDFDKYHFLPNTAGARSAQEAVRIAELCRAARGETWIKLEVTPEPRYLLPDALETLNATRELVKKGFTVLPYMQADPVLAKRLEDVGAASVMPLGSPIGSNQGIRTRDQIEIIIEQSRVPVVVDAGIGLPSHAAEAMEMGADAVLVNTAIAVSENPVDMAKAFQMAVEAGRKAFLAGPGSISRTAVATSPQLDTFLV